MITLYQSKSRSGRDGNILRALFPGAKAEERVPSAAPIAGSPGDGDRPPCAPRKAQPEKSRSLFPSPPRKKEGWPGAPYLAELPRFYILLLPFVKFQMETSNISRGNQPNIGQRVKSKRMAELSLSPSASSTPASTYIYTYTFIYIYMCIY